MAPEFVPSQLFFLFYFLYFILLPFHLFVRHGDGFRQHFISALKCRGAAEFRTEATANYFMHSLLSLFQNSLEPS